MINKILLILCLSCNLLNSQIKTDIEDVFKMHLFLNRQNVVFRTMDSSIVKNDSLYDSFKNLISLKIETMRIESALDGIDDEHYKFYRVQDSGITYKRELIKDESKYLSLSCWMNGSYILAINQETGASYRLKGFDTNDFLGFLSEFKVLYYNNNSKKLQNSFFFKKYKVEDLDFYCLYEGLRSEKINIERYACLKKCSEPIKLH